jgi:hypothetical protein
LGIASPRPLLEKESLIIFVPYRSFYSLCHYRRPCTEKVGE